MKRYTDFDFGAQVHWAHAGLLGHAEDGSKSLVLCKGLTRGMHNPIGGYNWLWGVIASQTLVQSHFRRPFTNLQAVAIPVPSPGWVCDPGC